MSIDYYKGLFWDRPLTGDMLQFEEETGKNAVWNFRVTGNFEKWLYRKQKEEKLTWKKAKEFEKNRELKSRISDEKQTAKNVSHIVSENWFKNPASSDIWGIDTKKIKAKNIDEVINFLMASFIKINKQSLNYSDFKIINNNKAILTITPRSTKDVTLDRLRDIVEIRYNNISIISRKRKTFNDDFWILINNKI